MLLERDDLRDGPLAPDWERVVRVGVAAAMSPFDHVLAVMVAAGLGVEALCLYLGFARAALFDRLADLRLPLPHERPLRRAGGKNPWSPDEVRRLIAWWVDGVRVRDIADEMGRSRSAIYSKRRRLSLPSRDRRHLVSLADLEAREQKPRPSPHETAAPHSSNTSPVASPVSLVFDAGLGSAVVPVSFLPGSRVGGVQENGFLFPVIGNMAGTGETTGPIIQAFVAVEVEHTDQPAVPVPLASGEAAEAVRLRPPELIAAMARLDELWRRNHGAGNAPDWSRTRRSKEFVLEIALRGLANQSNVEIASAMGISCKKSIDVLSRLQIRRVLTDVTVEFHVERAFEKLDAEGLVPRTCKELKRLFFGRKADSAQYCREGLRKKSRREEREGMSWNNPSPRSARSAPSMPVFNFLRRPMPATFLDEL